MTRYCCRTCGHTIEVHVAVVTPPSCEHKGTTSDAKRPAVMEEEGE